MKQRRSHNLKSLLIISVLPLAFTSVVIVTALSGVGAWIGANEGGRGWTNLLGTLTPELLDQAKTSTDLRINLFYGNEDKEILENLGDDEIAFYVGKNGRVKTILKTSGSDFKKQELPAYLQITTPGFHLVKNTPVYCAINQVNNNSSIKMFVLVKKLSFLIHKLAQLSSAEMILLNSDGTIIDSTIENTSNEVIFPMFDQKVIAQLRSASTNHIHSGKMKITVEDYKGFPLIDNASVLYRGESQFNTFFSFYPIFGTHNGPIAYIGMLAPEDVLLRGAKIGIFGASLLGIVLLLIGAFSVFRISKKLADPLELITEKVHALSKSLGESVGITELNIETANDVPKKEYAELRQLEKAIKMFEYVFIKTEELRQSLDDERARSFMSSKLVSLGEMAGGIAHEINSPLAAIRVLSETSRHG